MEAVLIESPIGRDRGEEALRAHILGEGITLLKRRDSYLVGVSKMARGKGAAAAGRAPDDLWGADTIGLHLC